MTCCRRHRRGRQGLYGGRERVKAEKAASSVVQYSDVTGLTHYWTRVILAALATRRITHLLASEDGPAGVIARARARLGTGFAGQLMDCFYCLSIWVAAPMAWLVVRGPVDLLLTWLALSGAASLLERVGGESAVIRPFPQETNGEAARKEMDDGMLRPEAGGAQELFGGDGNAGLPDPRAR